MDTIISRKVGACELAVGVGLVELAFGSGPRAIIFAGLAVALYYAKRHFKGEFSLSDIRELVKGKA
jgi:hypothetical protein